jgi:hypothetical protein
MPTLVDALRTLEALLAVLRAIRERRAAANMSEATTSKKKEESQVNDRQGPEPRDSYAGTTEC